MNEKFTSDSKDCVTTYRHTPHMKGRHVVPRGNQTHLSQDASRA